MHIGVFELASWLILSGKLQLHALLTRLHEMGIRTLMVEGGATVITSFMRSGLVDHLIITISPSFVGAEGVTYEADDKVSDAIDFL